MSLIEYVKQHVDATKYYKSKFPEWDGHYNTNVACPFVKNHENGTDKKPSFSVNIRGTGGCYCHACDTKIGSIVHYEKVTSGLKSDEDAASRIYNDHIRPVLASPNELEDFLSPVEAALRGVPAIQKTVINDLSISKEDIVAFKLGWDSSKRRMAIPIIDEFGQLLNIRKYRLPSMRDNPEFGKIENVEGYGSPAEMFPKQRITALCNSKHKPHDIFWMSGERDTILGWNQGLPSFCYTTGERTLGADWAAQIKTLGTRIGIVQDNNKTGREGAEKRRAYLQSEGIQAYIIELPGDGIIDYSDWVKAGGTTKQFLELGDPKNEPEPQRSESEPNGRNGSQPHPPDGGGESDSDYSKIESIFDPTTAEHGGEHPVVSIGRNPSILNRPITCQAIVSGRLDRTYSIPSIVRVGDVEYEIPVSREALQLVRENDANIGNLLRKWINTKAVVVTVETRTVIEVEIIPVVRTGIEDKNNKFAHQKCYFFGDHIECNLSYEMQIIPTTETKTQEVVGMIVGLKPISSILDNYSFSDEAIELLHENFHVATGEKEASRLDRLRELASAICENHTRIFNRIDVHLVALLSWLCPLEFEFPREGLRRGWINALVLGDTETGKSEICKAITRLLDCGVFISAESCSFVGLVGGAVKSSSGMNILRWGKIPLYNRQLVVVEELSGMPTEDISKMSEIRSAGIARYDKAGLTGETSAKTRLICLSNVRGATKNLADYPTGVQAAQNLIGQNEDLARFDLVVTAIDDEVKSDIINADRSKDKDERFSKEDVKSFKELAMFAWSLKPDQIDFSSSAYAACLTETMRLAGQYHPSIPIFKAGSGRLKLARIALAIACIQFAWDRETKKLVVTNEHVECAAELLDSLYKKPSFGYARYSRMMYNLQRVLDPEGLLIYLKEIFKQKIHDFFSYLANNGSFGKFDIADAMGINSMYVERAISKLFLANCLKKAEMRGEWMLTKAGRLWVDTRILELEKL